MTAETLRRAAALMRERAEAAPWTFVYHSSTGWHPVDKVQSMDAECQRFITFDAADEAEPLYQHFMSWHPAVALAVAAWLDELAGEVEADPSDYCAGQGHEDGLEDDCSSWFCATVTSALAVARAYLGET